MRGPRRKDTPTCRTGNRRWRHTVRSRVLRRHWRSAGRVELSHDHTPRAQEWHNPSAGRNPKSACGAPSRNPGRTIPIDGSLTGIPRGLCDGAVVAQQEAGVAEAGVVPL